MYGQALVVGYHGYIFYIIYLNAYLHHTPESLGIFGSHITPHFVIRWLLWCRVRYASFNSDLWVWHQVVNTTSTWFTNIWAAQKFQRRFLERDVKDGICMKQSNLFTIIIHYMMFFIISLIFSITTWYKNHNMAWRLSGWYTGTSGL